MALAWPGFLSLLRIKKTASARAAVCSAVRSKGPVACTCRAPHEPMRQPRRGGRGKEERHTHPCADRRVGRRAVQHVVRDRHRHHRVLRQLRPPTVPNVVLTLLGLPHAAQGGRETAMAPAGFFASGAAGRDQRAHAGERARACACASRVLVRMRRGWKGGKGGTWTVCKSPPSTCQSRTGQRNCAQCRAA